jgi:hypothetical protein
MKRVLSSSAMLSLTLAATLGTNCLGYGNGIFIPPEKPYKPCLVCGEPHQHNNSFCSADCCKSYRKEGK